MDLKQLRALLTVAETGNVTKASALLNIVQPAVSRQLRLLEDDLGTVLFERGRHGMHLTDAGKAMVEYARRIMNEVERARAEIKPNQGPVSGLVTVGLLPSTSDLLSGALLQMAGEQFPGIRLRFAVGYDGYLQQWLDTGEVDLALLYDPKPSPTRETKALLEESLWVVGAPSHKLRPKKPVAFSWLAGRPLVLSNAPHGLRSLVEQAAALTGTTLSIVAETNSMNVQKSLTITGRCITVLPSIAVADDVARGVLCAAPLTDPPIRRRVVLALPTTRQVSVPVRCVAPLLEQCIRDAVHQRTWPAATWLAASKP